MSEEMNEGQTSQEETPQERKLDEFFRRGGILRRGAEEREARSEEEQAGHPDEGNERPERVRLFDYPKNRRRVL